MEEILKILEKLDHRIGVLGKSINSTWLDLHEAALYLKISESTLRKMISFGAIPFKRLGAGAKSKILFSRKQLDLFVIYGKANNFSKRERESAQAWV